MNYFFYAFLFLTAITLNLRAMDENQQYLHNERQVYIESIRSRIIMLQNELIRLREEQIYYARDRQQALPHFASSPAPQLSSIPPHPMYRLNIQDPMQVISGRMLQITGELSGLSDQLLAFMRLNPSINSINPVPRPSFYNFVPAHAHPLYPPLALAEENEKSIIICIAILAFAYWYLFLGGESVIGHYLPY
jgi:hypothetical protein